MSTPDYYSVSNGPADTQYSEDYFVTYCLTSSFILLCALPLVTHFKDSILQTFLCIGDSIHCIYFFVTNVFNTLYGLYTIWKELKQLQPQDQCFQQPETSKPLVQISPLLEQLSREQLITPPSTEQIPSIQDLYQ